MADYEIVLRELEPVLRSNLGDHVDLREFSYEPLLPPGENFGSTIFAVRALIARAEDRHEEELDLVAKMMPDSDYQRTIFDSAFTFKKEIFFYRDLAPAYRRLEEERGIGPDEGLFDMAPRYYGSRTSLEADGELVDDDAVLLMDNLKVKGYYMAERREGEAKRMTDRSFFKRSL